MSQQTTLLELYAGARPDGERVYEKVAVTALDDGSYQLLHSPGFVWGLARGDIFSLLSREAGTFTVSRRLGNIAVRIYSRDSSWVDAALTPMITQMDGKRDIMSDYLLVYTLPLEAGFSNIETTLDQILSGNADASWAYGNVYDEFNGEPLNWWLQRPAPPPSSH
jgi:hypothetical protein